MSEATPIIRRMQAPERATAPAGASPTPPVSTGELCTYLEPALDRYRGRQGVIVRLERRQSPYRSSFAMEELDVWLEDGSTLRLMFKDLGDQGLLEAARDVKPAFLRDPLREIETYRRILASRHLGTAAFYGAEVDQTIGRYWLFLERVPGRPLNEIGDFAAWQQTAVWLALLHRRFTPASYTPKTPLLRYDREFYRVWLRRARTFLRQSGPADLRRLEWLAERHESVVERLVALPATFIHGEFYASNVLVNTSSEETRVCPVDWEMAAAGPALVDLASLIAGRWTEEQKGALALTYYAALNTLNTEDAGSQIRSDVPDGERLEQAAPPAAFWAALDSCQLHLAVQWLGWAPHWAPPPGHAQDWLGDAVRAAERLGL